MATAGTIRGGLGHVKYAYLTAAIVTDYLIAPDEFSRAPTLTGTVADANPIQLAQSPLLFVQVVNGRAFMRWPIEFWTMAGTQCRARLGAPRR